MNLWKVASYNVNSIRARLPLVVKWLHKEKPHVLCLQETKVPDKDFPEEEIRATGYNVVYRGEKSYNGVAILSLSPPRDVRFGLPGKKDRDESRLIAATIDGIPVVNTYIPQGRDPESDYFQYKLKWFDRLLEFFKKNYSPDQPLLWVGDLNVAPEDKDVWAPHKLLGHVDFHPEVHKKLKKVMEWGFVDVFRLHNPNPGEYTYWDYRIKGAMEKGVGWRVDHIMATRPLAEKSRRAWIDREPRKANRPSDHTPILAEFDI